MVVSKRNKSVKQLKRNGIKKRNETKQVINNYKKRTQKGGGDIRINLAKIVNIPNRVSLNISTSDNSVEFRVNSTKFIKQIFPQLSAIPSIVIPSKIIIKFKNKNGVITADFNLPIGHLIINNANDIQYTVMGKNKNIIPKTDYSTIFKIIQQLNDYLELIKQNNTKQDLTFIFYTIMKKLIEANPTNILYELSNILQSSFTDIKNSTNKTISAPLDFSLILKLFSIANSASLPAIESPSLGKGSNPPSSPPKAPPKTTPSPPSSPPKARST